MAGLGKMLTTNYWGFSAWLQNLLLFPFLKILIHYLTQIKQPCGETSPPLEMELLLQQRSQKQAVMEGNKDSK